MSEDLSITDLMREYVQLSDKPPPKPKSTRKNRRKRIARALRARFNRQLEILRLVSNLYPGIDPHLIVNMYRENGFSIKE